MAFLFARNKQKVIADLARDTRGLLEKLRGVESLPGPVSFVVFASEAESWTERQEHGNGWLCVGN